jgi:ABC-type nitrate/sulfonate/bicarbonate transport system substrate-binding protein
MSDEPTEVRIIDACGPHEKVNEELMRRLGHLDRLGIRVSRTYVRYGSEAVELLVGGHGDIAMQVGFGAAVAAIAGGAPLRVVAGSNLLTVHAVYSKDASIRSLRDLRHRSVGIGARGALTHQLISAALRKHRVDPATVLFVPIGNSATIFEALLAGQVDAGFGETNVFGNQAHYGVHALDDGVLWRELPEFPNQASFATLRAIAERRDALVRTLAAHALLYRHLHAPESWESYAAAWERALPGSDLGEVRSQWQFYQQYHPYAEDLRLKESQLDYLQELNAAMNLQQRTLSFGEVTDMSLARDALRIIGPAAT